MSICNVIRDFPSFLMIRIALLCFAQIPNVVPVAVVSCCILLQFLRARAFSLLHRLGDTVTALARHQAPSNMNRWQCWQSTRWRILCGPLGSFRILSMNFWISSYAFLKEWSKHSKLPVKTGQVSIGKFMPSKISRVWSSMSWTPHSVAFTVCFTDMRHPMRADSFMISCRCKVYV